MSEKWQAYVKDPRTICKFGIKCYQKNPDHHKTYKHPPNLKKNYQDKPNNKRFKPSPKQNMDVNAEVRSHSDNEVATEEIMIQKDESSTSTKVSNNVLDDDNVIKLPSPVSYHDKGDTTILKELFLVDMPQDFFQFFKSLSEDTDFVKMLSIVHLELIGPYDLLLGKLPVLEDKELYLIHWRFFYDPPEFQAVLKKKGKSQFHIGYFRDEPDTRPVFVASNDVDKGCHITPMSENIFGAVYLYLQNEKKNSPFASIPCQKLIEKVKKWAEEHNYSLDEYNMKSRLVQTVAKTFHGAGIVVPYNKKTKLGYRHLVENDTVLRKLFTKLEAASNQNEKDKILSEIQPVITYANIAVDECDFGTGLEMGVDLFCSGLKELQPSALSCLCSAYTLLNRDAFSKIARAHMKYRRKGPNMSILSEN